MATLSARKRASSGPGTGQWIALGAAALLILSLTFTLGLLVGRQWARHPMAAAAADPVRKTAATPRGRGLAEAGGERPLHLGEKLTFYQTLTAPLAALPPPAKAGPAPRPEAAPRPAPPPPAAQPALPPAAEPAARPARQADEPKAGERPAERMEAKAAPGFWTVQAAALKARRQAESVHTQLRQAGLDAYIAEVTGEDGQIRYRVRVGSFKAREEALRVAERLRAERGLAAFVTPR